MIDREKVIKGLECHKRAMCGEVDEHGLACNTCPYKDMESTCHTTTERQLIGDALDLLKAQEPRVLTLEEVIAHYSLPPVFVDDLGAQEDCYEDIQPLYFEFSHDSEAPCYVHSWYVHWRGHAQVARHLDEWKHSYNKKWRCWTSRPTDEQREATPWE